MSRVNLLPARMAAKVTVEKVTDRVDTPCWIWTGCLNSRGYGCTSFSGKVFLTHRVAYQDLVGPIPAGLQLDHLCAVTRCCNPKHLEPVSAKVNSERSSRATKMRCVNDHPLVGDNLILKTRPGDKVQRNCRTCQAAAQRRYRANRKAAAA